MPSTFTRANSYVPRFGPEHLYWMHGSGLCHMAVWTPSTSFQNAPVMLCVGGDGYGHSPGWNQITGFFANYPKQLALAAALSAKGWVIVSIDYPAASKNEHLAHSLSSPAFTPGAFRIAGSWAEVAPVAMWPEQPYYLARAIQHVKDNYSAIVGASQTPLGLRLWGKDNSIDPARIVVNGMKHGATMALYVAMQPTGLYSFDSPIAHENQDIYSPRSSARVNAVIATDPMIDFTQLHIDPDYDSPAPSIFQGDKWAAFARAEDFRPWSQLETFFKRQCPWFVLHANYAENANLSFFTEFSGVGFDDPLWDEDLAASDWSPGTVRNDTANAKAWIDPTDGRFQGEPWRVALSQWGGPSQTSAMIRRSVTRYGTGDYAPYSTSAYVAAVESWLGLQGYQV